MIFHYLARDKVAGTFQKPTPIREPVYFLVEISQIMNRKLSDWSGRHQSNLASFCGLLIHLFLGRFETDPRELKMIHHVSTLLDEKALLTESDLRDAMSHCAGTVNLRLRGRSLTTWFYSRLKPLLSRLDKEDASVELTMSVVEDLLADTTAESTVVMRKLVAMLPR